MPDGNVHRRLKTPLVSIGTICAAGLVALVATPLLKGPVAAAAEPWPVQNTLYGKPDKASGEPQGETATDVSGLACAPPAGTKRLCLLVDDESQGAQIAIIGDGQIIAGDVIRLSRETFDSKAVELDPEAVAYAKGAFYVIGSHGRARHENDPKKAAKNAAKAKASRHLFRVVLAPGTVDLKTGKLSAPPGLTESAALEPFFKQDTQLSPKYDVALADGGLTIEGLAVADDQLTIGFRGPIVGGKAVILDLPLAILFESSPGTANSTLVDLGTDTAGSPRGIRDLVAFQGDFVGIAGPMLDPSDEQYEIKEGDYALFWWHRGSKPILFALKGYGAKVKPEALMPLDMQERTLHSWLLFDGPQNGKLTAIDTTFAAQ